MCKALGKGKRPHRILRSRGSRERNKQLRSNLSNKLLHSKGPVTWPRLFAKAKLALGEGLGMQMSEHPRTSKKSAKKPKAEKAAALVATRCHRASRAAGVVLGESSNMRQYYGPTEGFIHQVCD